MKTVVAIHQPNFFPWLGYFDKLARADVFVILDHVQFPKTKGNWGNRVQLLVGGSPHWTTLPIRRDYHGVRSYDAMLIAEDKPWRRDLMQTLHANYARAAAFHEVVSLLEPLVNRPIENLARYNLAAIGEIARWIGVDPGKIVLSSSLSVGGQATEMLIDLVRAVGGTAYLCGGGSGGYLEPEKFAEAGIGLLEQGFRHPVYQQVRAAAFVPGLSCIDALMNCGPEQVSTWFARGPGDRCERAA